MFNKKFRT